MLSAPTGSVLRVRAATPLEFSVTGPEPRVTPPRTKLTVPVGLAPAPVSVAVSVTDAPKADEVAEAVSFTVGVACFTVSLSAGEVVAAA
jgi:hypothetical protein